MDKKTNVVTNFLYNSVYQILIIILPLITAPYISRVIGARGIGIYSYTYSVANCFALVGMLGINNYGNRTIAFYQDNREKRSIVFWNIFATQIISTICVTLVYIIYLCTVCQEQYRVVSIIQICTVVASLCDINWFFFGMEKFKITVTRNIIIRVLTVLAIFIFVKSESDVGVYTILLVGGHLISNIVIWPFLKKEIDFVRPTFKEMKIHIKEICILFIPVIATTLYHRMDKIMIGALSTMKQNGFYENTEKIITVPMGIITALGTVMLPRMSSLYARGNNKIADKYIELSMEFISCMGTALMFGIAGISNEFMPLFFGKEFIGTGILVVTISPVVLIKSWANVIRMQYLIPLKYDKAYVRSVWLGAFVNLTVNTILIPQYGAMGAVVGTLLAEASVMMYQTIYVRNMLPIGKYIKGNIYYIIAGGVMFVGVRAVAKQGSQNIITIISEIAIGVIIYSILCCPYIWRKHKLEIIEMRLKYKK